MNAENLLNKKKLFIKEDCNICHGVGFLSGHNVVQAPVMCPHCCGSGGQFRILSPAELAPSDVDKIKIEIEKGWWWFCSKAFIEQAKEDKQKAEAWDKVVDYLTQEEIDDILAQSKEETR